MGCPSIPQGKRLQSDTITLIRDEPAKLNKLQLKAMAGSFDTVLSQARQQNLSILVTLNRLADLEIERRWQAALKLRRERSKLAEKVSIDQFDFDHHKSRKEQKNRVLHLLDLEFVRERMDVILIGNPGTGKSFLANCIAGAACNANVKVLFTTAMDMINHLIAAEADHSLLKKLQHYQAPDLLVCDELGYLSLGQQGSHLFFQVISARHQKKSTMLTTNLPFADRGKVFDSTTLATAIHVLSTAFYTGMRRGEILSLTWNKVDLEKRNIQLEAADTKDREPRTIPICNELLEVLKSIPRALHDNRVFLYEGKPAKSIKTGLIRA